MADPLALTAQTMVPPTVGRSLLDPNQSGDILRRYQIARGEEAAATDRLQQAALVDRIQRDRETWDRDTKDYEEQQAFKQTRGNVLESIAGLDPDNDDYDVMVSDFLASAPEVAIQDDAVQALLSVKQRRRDENLRLKQEEIRTQRLQREADQRVAKSISLAMAEEGLDPSPFNDAEGNFDMFGAVRQLARGRKDKDLAEASFKARQELDKADALYFDKDPETLDYIRSGDIDSARNLLKSRFEGAPVKLDPALLDTVFTDTEDAFVARAQKPIAEAPLAPGQDAKEREPLLHAYRDAARAVYSAARGVRRLERQGAASPAAAVEKPKAVNPYLESLRQKVAK